MITHDPKQRRQKLIFLLWSLLFTKCFSLEYLVREYEVPINSFYYIWCLSITMATVATFVYGRVERVSIRTMLLNRTSQLQVGALVLSAATVLWTLLDPSVDSRMALFLAAIFMGIRQLFAASQSTPPLNWPRALAWILAGLAIFFTAPPTGYLFFAFGLLLISAVPRATELLRKTEK